MGLGNYDGDGVGTVDQLVASGVPNSFSLFMCPAYRDVSGSLGQLNFATIDELRSSPFAEKNTSFGWVDVPEGVNAPWYVVSLVQVSVQTDSLNSKQQLITKVYGGTTNVPNPGGCAYNSIMDSGTCTIQLSLFEMVVTAWVLQLGLGIYHK